MNPTIRTPSLCHGNLTRKTGSGDNCALALLVVLVLLALPMVAPATTLTWDANGATAGQVDGAGAWLGTGQWWNGSGNVVWADGSDAVFGNGGNIGNGAAVTLSGPVTVNSLTVNAFTVNVNYAYTLGTSGQTITLNTGLTMNSGAGTVTTVSPVTLAGAQTWVNRSASTLSFNATSSLAVTLNNGGNLLTLQGPGVFDFSTAASTLGLTITGAGGLTVDGARVTLAGSSSRIATTSSYTGTTTIQNGGNLMHYGNLASGNLTINGGNLGYYYGSYNFIRSLGTGVGQVQILGGVSGFSEEGNGSTVTLNNSASYEVVWGAVNEAGNANATGFFNPSTLAFQSDYGNAGKTLTFANKLDLNGTTRTIKVSKDVTTTAILSGVIRDSSSTAGLIKTGVGKLTLSSGANTYPGTTTINGGALQFNGSVSSIGGSGRSVTVANGAIVAAGYAIDNTFLKRLAENNNVFTVALGAASTLALDFSSSTGANLPNVSLGATANATYSGTLTPNGTTYRFGGGGATLTVSSALTTGKALVVGGGAVTLISSGNTYDSATTLNAGGTLTLSGSGVINGSTAITLNRGALTLANTTTAEGSINRVKDTAPVTSNGGTITYNNTSGANLNYAETIGSVTLATGQLDIVEAVNQNNATANTQTLTLSGLTRTGTATISAVTFSAASTAPNATANMIKVSGASATSAGQIIGAWATTGTTAALQTDYAKYDGSANVLPAAIAATAETTWTTAANAYTLNGATTLTGTRMITALRYSGGNANLTLASGCNLATLGVLFGGTAGNALTIAPGTGGALTTPTGNNNLYLTTGNGGVTVSAPITDNGGALSLVKSGTGGTLILSGSIAYSGNTVVNAGTLQLNSANANNNASTVTIAPTGATLNLNFAGTDTVGQLYIGTTRMADGVYKAVGSADSGTELAQITGTGTLTVTDITPPTLAGSSIVDDKSGGPILQGTLVTYTVTFSEDMDASTIDATDFGNAGDAVVTIGTVTETTPTSGIFTVPVTTTGGGTLQLQVNAGAVLKDVVGNALNTASAIPDDTTITVTSSDSTPPTLTGIVDNKSPAIIAANTLVTYTLTFSEPMAAGTVDATDFSNAGNATCTIGTVSQSAAAVFTVQATPTSGGTLQLQVNQNAVLTDLAGNALVTTSALPGGATITVDATPPTLTSIVDNKSGGPIQVNTPVTYTVAFSEDMDGSTVTAADFGNAGTAAINIGTVTETAPTSGIFTVPVTPTGVGTLQLQVNAGAGLNDVVGNALVNASAIPDDTTITVNPDTVAPTPDPMTWASVPASPGSSSIAMTAAIATDLSGVEYSFECTAGGGHSSGWQNSATYTDTGLAGGTTYTYRVRARDKSPAQNATGFSATAAATTYQAGTFSSSATPPTVDGADIASLVTATGSDKWYGYGTAELPAGAAKGQTFTTGDKPVLFKAVTYKCDGANRKPATPATPTIYTVRVGSVSGTTFTPIAGAICSQTFTNDPGSYMTWTLASPVLLAANTTYAVDVAMTIAGLAWNYDSPLSGIPYLSISGNTYASGQLYNDNGTGTTIINATANQDRVFHLDMDAALPTLTSIVDDQSGGPVAVNNLVTYTVTFSKDMDASTVSAADFGNAGTAAISIGTVTETAPTSGIFTVPVTPTSDGTVQLQVSAGADLKSAAGYALDTTSAILDDTTITVGPNHAPVAPSAHLAVSTDKNTAATIYLAKLVAGATDVDNPAQALAVTAVSPSTPHGGTVLLETDDVKYTPATGYTGPDSFTYTISDNGSPVGTVVGTVDVTVNDPSSGGSLNVVVAEQRGSDFYVQFAGIPGCQYRIQYSASVNGPYADFSPDPVIKTAGNTAGDMGLFEFQEPMVSGRFYKTTYESGP